MQPRSTVGLPSVRNKDSAERELWQTNTPAKGRKKQAEFVIQG